MTRQLALGLALVAFATPALAEPAREAPPEAPPITAADVEGAPPPGDESGRADPIGDGDSTARKIGRAALFVPRGAFELVMFPIRAGVYATDRYNLIARFQDVFYTDDRTLGLYPTLQFASEFGANIGARFDMKFGPSEQLKLFGAYGGEYREIATGRVRSEQLGGRLEVGLDTRYEKRRRDRFFGIGNGDEVPPPPMPIDALVDDTAVSTRYRRRIASAAATADLRAVSDFYVAVGGTISDVERSPSDDGPPIEMVFTPGSLIDFDDYRYTYGELEARWDTRDRTGLWEPGGVRSRGSLVSAFGGRVSLDHGEGFFRYGVDLQHYLRIGTGPRVLAARFYGEAVTGERDQVPFPLFPYLGGPQRLRGYATERFRDRLAAVASVEYQWDLSRLLHASLFVDTGRVYEAFDDLTLSGLRLGFGVGFDLYTDQAFLGRASLSSSIDGGAYLNVAIIPSFDNTPRVRRR